MSLLQKIRENMTSSMKEKNDAKKSILRVVLGDVSTQEARNNKALTDDEIEKIIRKLIQGNEETMSFMKAETDSHTKLITENAILGEFLSLTLTRKQIKDHLAHNGDFSIITAIKNAKNDGHATGLAVKFLKTNLPRDVKALGDDVSAVVKEIRS